jgi:hypothetical protein|nr:MAG TPA: hypothetical protein [Caudoviricetes sp.]
MKVLKDPVQALQVMDAKIDELRNSRKKLFTEAEGKEASVISGQETAIIRIAVYIRHAIKHHGCFGAEDMACVHKYADDAKEEANKYYSNPRVNWFVKGLAEGAAWACVGIEVRMEEP